MKNGVCFVQKSVKTTLFFLLKKIKRYDIIMIYMGAVCDLSVPKKSERKIFMNKLKKLFAVTSAAAIVATSFSALSLNASAKTTEYGPLTWTEATTTGFSDSGRGASSIVTDFEGNSGNAVLMNNSGGTNGTVMSSFDAVTGAHVGIAYSAYFTSNYTNTKYIAVGSKSLARMSGDEVKTANTVFTVGNKTAGNIMINGSVDTGIEPNQWISVYAIADFNTKKVNITISKYSGGDVLYEGTVDFLDDKLTEISGITLNSHRGVTDPAIYLDDFELSTYDEAAITIAAESVSVAESGESLLATVENAKTVQAVAKDTGIVDVSYDEESGEIKATYIAEGKTTVDITATSEDGVSVYGSVDVISGSVELTSINVKYVYYNGDETVTVKDGYTINDVPVGTPLTGNDVEYDDVVLNSDFRYKNPSIENGSYVAVKGENTLNVVYANRDAAVKTIKASYSTDSKKITDVTVEIPEGYYVGDSYTFISNNYVTDTSGDIYAVGNDYTDDAEATILNDSANPVNSVLKKDIALEENTVLDYTVVKSPNACFYSEWEDILGITASNSATGRNIASGGKMCFTSSTVSFYDVTATGYYQVVITGGPKNRGFAVYQNEETANAATAVNDGTAFMYNKLVGDNKSYNNDQYGLYVVKTGLLQAGDKLVLRGFGDKGAADNLDYVLIRRIVTGDIIGSDGVSIIPGGQTSKFTFDSGLDVDPTWSITGVDGVSVDENGMVTVSENAAEGVATLKATIESADVEGSKEITIQKAKVESFVMNGAAAFSNGQKSTYSVSDVKDQFGTDITNAVKVQYSSTNADVVSIDEKTGVATANAVGETNISATISVGESTKTETKTVIIKNYFLSGTATGNETTINSNDFVTSDNIVGYMITTAKDGVKVAQTTVESVPSVIDTTGADSYEIAPIYKYTGVTLGAAFEDVFADGMYNITFKKGDTKRADILVNGYMVGNNVDQYGEGRAISDGAEYTINDAVINGGSITVDTADRDGTGALTWVQLVKAPSNVNRTKKVYILGDSLVATYYGSYAEGTEVGGARTGWGQVIENYFSDDVEVVNLANSGQYAAGLLSSAFPGVMAMAQKGDYFIIEAGYNDRSYSSREEMKASVISMVEQCEAKGIVPVLVSPNASAHDFKAGLQFASTMNEAAAEMQAKYDDVIFVDLAKLSYEFMIGSGISHTASAEGDFITAVKNEDGSLKSVKLTKAAKDSKLNMPSTDDSAYLWTSDMKPVTINVSTELVKTTYNLTAVGGDTLHSSYAAATKWAEIVAQGMKDAGADFVTTDYTYTFTDAAGGEVICEVK